MEGLELICFQIISSVGTAKSCFIEATRAAEAYDFDKAEKLIEEGDEMFVKGHEAHASLIQQEASGEPVQTTLLLVHAEDQLMAAENFRSMAEQQIILYKKIQALEAK